MGPPATWAELSGYMFWDPIQKRSFWIGGKPPELRPEPSVFEQLDECSREAEQ